MATTSEYERRRRAYRCLAKASLDQPEIFLPERLKAVAQHLEFEDALAQATTLRQTVTTLATGRDITSVRKTEWIPTGHFVTSCLQKRKKVDKSFESALRKEGLAHAADIFKSALGFSTQASSDIACDLPSSDDEVVKRLREQLALHYESFSMITIFANLDPVPIQDLFVQLRFTARNKESVDQYQIALAPFLDANSPRKLMVIWGQPGQGKTVLMKKICYDWAQLVKTGHVTDENQYIAGVELLFVLKLRNVNKEVEKISELIIEEFPNFGLLKTNWIKNNSGKILVLLDGFDELQPPTLCVELYSIFFNKVPNYAPPFPLVVTSRPSALHNIESNIPTAEVCGIVGSELRSFLVKYMAPNAANAERIEKYIEKEQSSLDKRVLRSPLLLAMLCMLVGNNDYQVDEQKLLPQTQTDLYTRLCDWLLEVEQDKFHIAVTTDRGDFFQNETVLKLCHLAFDKTVRDDGRLVFDEDEIKSEYNIDVTLAERLGILTSDGEPQRRHVARKVLPRRVSFLHRTFQEFFAAFYASENLPLFRQQFQKLKFKAMLSDQFLIFFAGRIIEAQAIEQLSACLQHKMHGAFEYTFHKTRCRKVFSSVGFGLEGSSPSYLSFITEPLCGLLISIRRETKAEQEVSKILGQLLMNEDHKFRIFSLIYAMVKRDLAIDVNQYFSLSGYEVSREFLVCGEYCYRICVLTKPVVMLLVAETTAAEINATGTHAQCSISVLPENVNYYSFLFDGTGKGFLSFVESAHGGRLRIQDRFCLYFRSSVPIRSTSVESEGDSSRICAPSNAVGVIEIVDGCTTDLTYEELPDAVTCARIMSAIVAGKVDRLALNFLASWNPTAQADSSQQRSIAVASNDGKIFNTAQLLDIYSLNFENLLHQHDIGFCPGRILKTIKTRRISLTNCKLSSEDFCSTMSLEQTKELEILILINCTSSTSLSIFEEVMKIVCNNPSVKSISFRCCDFPPDEKEGDKVVQAFTEIDAKSRIYRIEFIACDNISEKQRERLEALKERLPQSPRILIADDLQSCENFGKIISDWTLSLSLCLSLALLCLSLSLSLL